MPIFGGPPGVRADANYIRVTWSPNHLHFGEVTQMEHIDGGQAAADLELDQALARAIRQLIAEAVEADDPAGSA
jgi:hypothetical protein